MPSIQTSEAHDWMIHWLKVKQMFTPKFPWIWLLLEISFAATLFNGRLFAEEISKPTTLLFVDDHEVLYRSGTKRELHTPARHSSNPLVTGPEPRNQVGYCSVFRNPATGRYQMWYQLTGAGQVVCYAESDDGITWTKPDLNLITLKGIPERNIVLTSPDHYGASVVVDPSAEDSSQRYKMAYWSLPPLVGQRAHPQDDRGPDGGMYIAFSPDGIHWTKRPGPIMRGTYGRSQDPPLVGEKYPWGEINSVSDVIDASFDPMRDEYVVYAKAWIDAPDGKLFWKRAIVRSTSQDFLKWSKPQLVMVPDEFDGVRPADFPGTRRGVQLHGAPVFIRHGVYFALLQVADFESHGLQPIELAISRDGITWTRPFRGTPFLAVGKQNHFDAGRIWSNATPVVLDDEIRFYYGAYEHPWKFGTGEYPWNSKTQIPKSGIGLATLPLDRFAGVRVIERIGHITLKPRLLRAVNSLTMNADASAGSIRVELLSSDGHRLPGYTKADAVPITGDALRHPVCWKSVTLGDLPDEDIMIRIHLDRAEVFSLTLSK